MMKSKNIFYWLLDGTEKINSLLKKYKTCCVRHKSKKKFVVYMSKK